MRLARPWMVVLLCSGALVLAGCSGYEKEGSAEEAAAAAGDAMKEAGEAIDEAAEKTGEAIKEGAQEAGEAVKEGAEKAGEAVKQATGGGD